MSKRRLTQWWPGLCGALVSSVAAAASSGPQPLTASEDDYFANVPIVLTASRLDQPLNEAPGAVTVLAWGVWGLGSVALVLLGVGLHVGFGVWRRGGLRKAFT